MLFGCYPRPAAGRAGGRVSTAEQTTAGLLPMASCAAEEEALSITAHMCTVGSCRGCDGRTSIVLDCQSEQGYFVQCRGGQVGYLQHQSGHADESEFAHFTLFCALFFFFFFFFLIMQCVFHSSQSFDRNYFEIRVVICEHLMDIW